MGDLGESKGVVLWRLDRLFEELLVSTASIKAIQSKDLPAIPTGLSIFLLIFSDEAVGKECQPESERTSTNDDKNGEQGVHVSSADR